MPSYTVKVDTFKGARAVLVFDTQEAADAFENKMHPNKRVSRKEFSGAPAQARARAIQHLEDSGFSVDWEGDTGKADAFLKTHGAVAVRGRGRPGAV